LDRAKKDLLRRLEKHFKETDQQQNRHLAMRYVAHFLNNNPMPGFELPYTIAQKILPTITLEQVNKLSNQWISDENIVIKITGPEKEGIKIPSKEKVLEILKETETTKYEAYVDKVSNKPLIEKIPTASKIISEKKNQKLGTTEWTLSNGIKVVIKPTKFKEDEILISAFSKGGSSLSITQDLISTQFATTIARQSGVGYFSLIELQKMLTGKVVNVGPYISDLYEGFSGSCAPNDLETAMQLVYLYFTNPRFDKTATDAFMTRYKAFLQNKSSNPNTVFRDSISFILSDRHPRKTPLTTERLNLVNLQKAKEIYLNRFADASDFIFVFIGNINIEKAKAL
ncbi:MAG: insulinase family protein, partial [Cytophagales bacterium]|nr:insulinase family protein [Cytophagales bacterium]